MRVLANFDYQDIEQFSKRDKDFVSSESLIQGLLPYSSNKEGIGKSILERQKYPVDRVLLTEVLRDQYKDFKTISSVDQNIELLSQENTFSVTTAHQPVIFLGPMYVIYKALSAVKLAEELKSEYPKFDFVPFFIVGGEDHDFEEISVIRIFQKEFKWNFESHGQSVGNISPQHMNTLFEELEDLFARDPKGKSLLDLMIKAYKSRSTLVYATQEILHLLMGQYGLVSIDMSDPRLKRSFIPSIKKEILQETSKPLVEKEQGRIQNMGFKVQAHARDINFFYQSEVGRKRIVREEDHYKILDTDLNFSKDEFEAIIESYPERFSPNVIMRPVYQSSILPDILYVGGGGELAYWAERVAQFEAFDVHFPALIRRSSITLINQNSLNKWEKLNFEAQDLIKNEKDLVKIFIDQEVSFDLEHERRQLADQFEEISNKIKPLDASLMGKVAALQKSLEKDVSTLEKKVMASLKQKNQNTINKIQKIKQTVHSDKGLQERRDNVLGFYSQSSKDLIGELLDNIQVLPSRLHLLLMD